MVPETVAPALARGGTETTQRSIDEPLVDELLSADELDLRDQLRSVLDAEVRPRAAEVDAGGFFAEASFQALARAGFVGVMFPVEYGGLGRSTVAYAVAVEEITRACPSTSLIYATQTHAGYPILVAGSEAIRRRYLPGLCSGQLYGSLAITEPTAGSDAAALRTRARPQGEGYVLDGSKTFITTGDRSQVIVCFATVDPRLGRDGISAFVVDGEAEGLARGGLLAKLGMHGSTTAELFLTGVYVPRSAVLGEEGGAWRLSMRTVVKSRISAAAQGLGIAAAAYELALGWAAERGLLRGSRHQEVQFRLAELRTSILSARLQLHAAARAIDAGHRDLTAEVAMAKFTCTDLGFAAADQAVELLGAEGDLVAAGAERLLRDVKVTQIYDGTNEIQHLIVARDSLSRLEAAP